MVLHCDHDHTDVQLRREDHVPYSDIIVGYLIFWLIRDFTDDHKKATMGFLLWFLCPFVIISGSVIGMFDTISVMMLLLAVVMLRKGRYAESGVMLCMATLVKFFPGFLVFIFLAYIMSKHREEGRRKPVAHFAIGLLVTAFVILLPQMLDGTIADCFLFITSRLTNGTGAESLGVISGYAALIINILALAVAIYCAMLIERSEGKDLDMRFMDAALIIIAVLFLYPPLPQYVLLLLPFLLFAMAFEKRYILPCILLFIGTTISAIAGGPTDLVSIAVFTDLISLDPLLGIIDGYTAPIFGDSPLILIGYVGSAIQYAGILFVLWVRFGDRMKAVVAERKVSPEQ
jgi:Predicted integral membrane protein